MAAFSIYTAAAQEIEMDSTTGLYTYQKVLDFEGKSKDELYTKAMEWVALNYKSANDVIQHEDADKGKIICKGSFVTNLWLTTGFINHTLTLDFKDDKIRMTYSNFGYNSTETQFNLENEKMLKSGIEKLKKRALDQIISSEASLIEYINNDQNDDW